MAPEQQEIAKMTAFNDVGVIRYILGLEHYIDTPRLFETWGAGLLKVRFNMASIVQKINLGLAFLLGVVFAQVPADTNLKPCADAWYYPSKVLFYSRTHSV
jgi:hypothetical protein